MLATCFHHLLFCFLSFSLSSFFSLFVPRSLDRYILSSPHTLNFFSREPFSYMGFTVKQKIDICLKSDANPQLTQAELAQWAQKEFSTLHQPSQTTISRILSSKNELIASKETQFLLVRRKKLQNPLLRSILSEWITQCIWEGIPITTPVIQLTALSIWTRLPPQEKDGNGIFNHKWCYEFIKKLDINITGTKDEINANEGHKLNKVWMMDEKVDLKRYLRDIIKAENYSPRDIFTIDEFQLFYTLPLDQIFDVSSVDKGLRQSAASTEKSLTIMLGCNVDGSEKLPPLIVGSHESFDASCASDPNFKMAHAASTPKLLRNKILEVYNIYYNSNTNKWITSSMFYDYLLTLDHKIASLQPQRKILIVLDDSSSHRIINLKFDHIRLCFLKNNNNHNNPYSSLYSGVKFDYLPMSYGIIQEFKILYRIQQYLEMIRLQARRSEKSTSDSFYGNSELDKSEAPQLPVGTLEVLSESDYQIPTIKVIEWIWRSWNSISKEKIFNSWKRTYLLDLKNDWVAPAHVDVARTIVAEHQGRSQDSNDRSYYKLQEIMSHLNVVIPWEIDDLLGLVNERAKMTLSYVSIEEIIGSCLLEGYHDDKRKDSTWLTDTQIANSEIQNPFNRLNGTLSPNLVLDNGVESLLEGLGVSGESNNSNTIDALFAMDVDATKSQMAAPQLEDKTDGAPAPKRQHLDEWSTGWTPNLDMGVNAIELGTRGELKYSLQTILQANLGLSETTTNELKRQLEQVSQAEQ